MQLFTKDIYSNNPDIFNTRLRQLADTCEFAGVEDEIRDTWPRTDTQPRKATRTNSYAKKRSSSRHAVPLPTSKIPK